MKSHPIECSRTPAHARALLVIAVLAAFLSLPATARELYSWTQFAQSGLEARVVAQSAECPEAIIDGRETPMAVRARSNDAFPVLICALEIPKGARQATIDGRPLALPKARANKILLIGDTGCRMKAIFFQDCNSPESWPFGLAAEAAARLAPDLVVHVGDYYYRESPCPPLRQGCAGSPYGDNWASWKADFFDPGAALLRSAPWVFVRGNHEMCGRGGEGWSRALDPRPSGADLKCAPQDEPFAIDLGGLSLVVLDVTRAEDRAVDVEMAKFFRHQLATAAPVAGPVWYALHKPIFSSIKVSGAETIGDNKTLAEAARNAIPVNVQAILAGHLHTYQATSYVDDFPAQFVVGNGGDTPDPYVPANFDGLTINGVTVERGRSVPRSLGFATFERGDGEWLVTDYDTRGEALSRCHLRGRKIDCD